MTGIVPPDGLIPSIGSVVVTNDVGVEQPDSASVNAVTVGNGAAVTLAAANPDRRGLIVANNTGLPVYVKLGTGASTSSYSYKVLAGQTLELPTPIYTGAVTARRAAGSADVLVTEIENS